MRLHLATGRGPKMKAAGIFSTDTRCGRNDAQALVLTTYSPAQVTCRTCRKLLEQDLQEAREAMKGDERDRF